MIPDDIRNAFRCATSIAYPRGLALREVRAVWAGICAKYPKPIDAVRVFDQLATQLHGKPLDACTLQSLARDAIRRSANREAAKRAGGGGS